MFNINRLLKPISRIVRTFSRNYRVTVVGGNTEIGQHLLLLLRQQRSVTKLKVLDLEKPTTGVVLDLQHIPTESSLKGFKEEEFSNAIKGSDIIISTAGTIYKPGVSERELLTKNTEYIKKFAMKLARLDKMPFVGIVTEPINTMVPMAAEILRNHGYYNPKKLFGLTEIDTLRAKTLFAKYNNLPPTQCVVPVIGGRSDRTVIPLFSKAEPNLSKPMSYEDIKTLSAHIRVADRSIHNAKAGWSPTISVAYSIYLFVNSVMDTLDGKPATVNAYIENNDFGTNFFSGAVEINKFGVKEMVRYENLSQYELYLLEASIQQIRQDVMKSKRSLQYA